MFDFVGMLRWYKEVGSKVQTWRQYKGSEIMFWFINNGTRSGV